MTQLGLEFVKPPAVESVVQLALGFVWQVPLKYLVAQEEAILAASTNATSYNKLEVVRAMADLRIALAALDSGLGFDPSRFEVPYVPTTKKE